MPACPWCQAPITDPLRSCPACGGRPKDQGTRPRGRGTGPTAAAPSTVPGLGIKPATGRAELGDSELGDGPIGLVERGLVESGRVEGGGLVAALVAPTQEVPDLDFSPRASLAKGAAKAPQPSSTAPPPSAAPRRPPEAAPPSGPNGVSFDGGIDFAGNDLGAIDLDVGGHGATGANATGVMPRPPAAIRFHAGGVPVPASTLMQTEDGGRRAAERLADYGDSPGEWWKAPIYAYRVKIRQLELRRALSSRREELERSQSAADDALVVFAERVRKSVTQKDSYSKLLDAVAVAETALRERDSALAAETEAHHKQTAGLDERIARLEAELAVARAEEKVCADEFSHADAIRQRAEAKLKRIDIDVRSANSKASRRSLSDAAPGPSAGKDPTREATVGPTAADRTAERDARLAEVEHALPAVVLATQKLTAARRVLAGVAQKAIVLKNERAALENHFKKRGASHGVEVAKAAEEVRRAMTTLGRAAASDYANFGDAWDEARAELASLDKAMVERDDDVVVHVMALDVHDRKAVQTGMAVAFGALLLIALLAVVPLAFTALSGTKAPPRSAVGAPE